MTVLLWNNKERPIFIFGNSLSLTSRYSVLSPMLVTAERTLISIISCSPIITLSGLLIVSVRRIFFVSLLLVRIASFFFLSLYFLFAQSSEQNLVTVVLAVKTFPQC